ncbi:MAG TPA: GNAT family N-acetyltransferase [Chloroflexota bacterium]|nr:GNAT family N-acetyltransferase [Chloroflexota bacterium]
MGTPKTMRPWTTTENGALWVVETNDGLPPFCPARAEVIFAETRREDVAELAVAMNLASAEPIWQRLGNGRRCFHLRVDGQIATYGWVTRGVECVGELERQFHLHEDEAYIWDCGTVAAWRRQRFYSALLSDLIVRLHEEGVARIWIGASRQNRPSIQGFANAGFQPVVECSYGRVSRLTILWIQHAPAAPHPLIQAAYRILLNSHERRLGPLAIGYMK